MPVAVFGSLNQDLVTYTSKFPAPGETVKGTSFERHLGGKGFNEAVAISKLKSPNDRFTVKLFGCLGNDNSSQDFINFLISNNINISNSLKKLDNISTGTATILVLNDSTAQNRIIIVPGANAHFKPNFDDLNSFFNPSNHTILHSSIENPNIPSNLHSHATKPLNNEQMAKTSEISNHPPSHIHSHGSMASLNNQNNLTTPSAIANSNSNSGLVNKNGVLIHQWSASGLHLKNMNENSTPLNSSQTTFYNNNNNNVPAPLNDSLTSKGSFLHSHKVEPVLSSHITGSYNDHRNPNILDPELPSDLHAHASVPKMETLTYPSPKPSALDLQNAAITLASKAPVQTQGSSTNLSKNSSSNLNLTAQQRLTNVSFSLGGSSAHSSTASLSAAQNYLQVVNRSRAGSVNQRSSLNPAISTTSKSNLSDDINYMAVFQNEIPNSTAIIHHLAKNFPNVSIFYNPSPLPLTKSGFNNDLLTALHESHYIIVNETELAGLIKNYHPNPTRDPLTLLKNNSNFEPNSEHLEMVNTNLQKLSKLRTILTKPTLIVTLGDSGVLYSPSGQFDVSYVPSEDVDHDDIVDTTGAGDTFLGALITCIYRNESLESAIKFATRASAETIKKKGAAESMPYYKDVEKRGWLL